LVLKVWVDESYREEGICAHEPKRGERELHCGQASQRGDDCGVLGGAFKLAGDLKNPEANSAGVNPRTLRGDSGRGGEVSIDLKNGA